MPSILRLVRHNLLLKAVSLALAAGAWGYLRFIGNPIVSAHLDTYFHSLATCGH